MTNIDDVMQGLKLAIAQMEVLYQYASKEMPEHERTIHAAILERLNAVRSRPAEVGEWISVKDQA